MTATFHRRPTQPTLTIRSEGALPARVTLPRSVWHEPTDTVLELIRLCWQYAYDWSGMPLVGGRISITSEVPPNAGLASSATACVAVLRALMPTTERGAVAAAQLVRAAHHVERDVAGRPIGPMDFVPAAFGGTTLVHSQAETHHRPDPPLTPTRDEVPRRGHPHASGHRRRHRMETGTARPRRGQHGLLRRADARAGHRAVRLVQPAASLTKLARATS